MGGVSGMQNFEERERWGGREREEVSVREIKI